jgi:hypothetical protein
MCSASFAWRTLAFGPEGLRHSRPEQGGARWAHPLARASPPLLIAEQDDAHHMVSLTDNQLCVGYGGGWVRPALFRHDVKPRGVLINRDCSAIAGCRNRRVRSAPERQAVLCRRRHQMLGSAKFAPLQRQKPAMFAQMPLSVYRHFTGAVCTTSSDGRFMGAFSLASGLSNSSDIVRPRASGAALHPTQFVRQA